MASAKTALANGASGVAVIGLDDGDGLSGADTIFGFTGTDSVAPAARRADGSGDAFLDDTAGVYDAALGYAVAYQSLMAQAWKGAPSPILEHLDWGGSCAPGESAAADRDTPDAAFGSTAIAPGAGALVLAETAARLGAAEDGDGDIAFADAGVGGGDFFGMT